MGEIIDIQGNIFDAPDGAALIHACNCKGTWGKGIARAFQDRYPAAFSIYKAHCQPTRSRDEHRTVPASPLEGTALLIPPQEQDYQGEERQGRRGTRHWIICLFTSRGFGKSVDNPETILKNTELAVADLKAQLARLEDGTGTGTGRLPPPCALWSCKFNSGLFRVEWTRSRETLERAGLDVTVVSPE